MTDETPTTPPTTPEQERSWAPETGLPTPTPAPGWSEVEALRETSDEQGLEAWLDAQDDSGEAGAPDDAAAREEDAADPEEAAADLDADLEPDPSAASDPAPTSESAATESAPSIAVTETASQAGFEPEPEPEPEGDVPVLASEQGSHPGPAAAALASTAFVTTMPAEAVEGAQAEAGLEPEPSVVPDEEGSAPEAAAVPATRSGRLVVALLAALVLVLAGLTGFLAERTVSTRGGGGVEDARHDALQAARNAARLVFSYDYRQLDKDFAAGKAVSTGKFGEQYGSTTPKLVEVAKNYKAVVVADVSDAAVISAAKDEVKVLVFVNQQSTSTLSAAPKITQSRLTMTLVERDGRWLLSEVNAF